MIGHRATSLYLLSQALTAVALCGWTAKVDAQSSASGELSSCIDRVVERAQHQGARRHGEAVVDFLLRGDRRTYSYRLEQSGCLGFLAVGHRRVQQLDLTLYAPNGRILARDRQQGGHAYVRFCGDAGRSLVVGVQMMDGGGEVQLVPLIDAPARLTGLAATLARCVAVGKARPGPRDVGPEPLGPPIDVEIAALSRRLMEQGYEPDARVLVGNLGANGRETRRMRLQGDRCYAIAAVGSAQVHDMDLRVMSEVGGTMLVGADVSRHRNAVVKLCAPHTGSYLLDVRMYRGGGDYMLHSFTLNEPRDGRPPGLDSASRIPFAEIKTRLSRRGMRTFVVTWGLLKPGGSQAVPLRMTAGRCYAVAAVPSSDFPSGNLDLALVDEQGNLQAAEAGPSSPPLLFHCPRRSGIYRAVATSPELRRPGRYLLLMGEAIEDRLVLP